MSGEYAHAWPEVYIADAGWVAYEPTPQRGMPNAEGYTGVPEEQSAPGGGSEPAPTTETTDALPSDTTAPGRGARDPDEQLFTGDDVADRDTGSDSAPVRYVLRPILQVLPILLGLSLAYLVVFPLGLIVRRRRRRQRATAPLEQVHLAWTEAVEAAAVAGFDERASDTYVERAIRLGEAVPGAADPALTLAATMEVGVFSAEGAEAEDATVAWEASEAIRDAAKAQASVLERGRVWLDPRWLVRSWRRDRAARQRRITLTPRGTSRPSASWWGPTTAAEP